MLWKPVAVDKRFCRLGNETSDFSLSLFRDVSGNGFVWQLNGPRPNDSGPGLRQYLSMRPFVTAITKQMADLILWMMYKCLDNPQSLVYARVSWISTIDISICEALTGHLGSKCYLPASILQSHYKNEKLPSMAATNLEISGPVDLKLSNYPLNYPNI